MEELKLSELLKQNLLLLESKCKKLCEDEDIEAIETYALMFTDLGDCNVKNIIKTGDIRILDILQHFFKIEGKHFKACVGFFSYFCDSLIENHPDKNRRKEIIIHFKDFFESLINTIMTKSIMPENKFLDFNNKFEGHHDFDEIFNIRKDLGGLLKKLGLCIGNYEMYELLIVQLQELLTKEETNLEDINIIIQLENLLFAISFCIQLIDNQDEIQNFNTCLTLMFKIPSDKYAALRRANFENKLDDDSLYGLLKYTIEGFNHQCTFDISSQCFERLVLKNMNRFSSSLGEFLEHINTFSAYIDRYNQVWSKVFTTILTLATSVYGNSPEEFGTSFQKCISPFINHLQEILESEHQDELQIIYCLEYIADMFYCIEKSTKDYGMIKIPTRETFIIIWPYILKVMENYSENEKVFEATSRLIKKAIRGLYDDSDALDSIVKEYLMKVATMYSVRPASWLIYPVEICAPIFAPRDTFKSDFNELVNLYTETTFNFINSIEKVKAEPYIAADFLSLMAKLLRCCPELVFCGSSFNIIVEFSVICCDIEHQDLIKSLCNFQIELFIILKEIQSERIILPVDEEQYYSIGEFAFSQGKIIFEKYIKVILSVPLKDILENIVDCLTEIIILFPYKAVEWINESLCHVPRDCLSDAEKNDFCKDFEFGDDSVHNIHKSFEIFSKRSRQRMLRGIK